MERAFGNNAYSTHQGMRAANNTVAFPQARAGHRVKLGQLLVESGIITAEKLHEALKIAQDSGHPVGKVLSALNYVSEKDLQSAFLAQSLVGEGILDEVSAVKALKTASKAQASLAEVLEQTEAQRTTVEDSAELEELLTRTRLISEMTYNEAKAKSVEENIPFGRALLLINGITFAHLNSTLEALSLIRAGKLSQEEALRALKEVKRSHITLEQAIGLLKISPRTTVTRIKLGDLLSRSRVISERENLAAVERALIERRMLGEILVGSGLVSSELVNDALFLQQMIVREVISLETATNVLKRVKERHQPLSQVAAAMGIYNDDDSIASGVIAILMKAEIISISDVKRAKRSQSAHQMGPLKALLASDIVSPVTYHAAAACIELVRSGKLSEALGVVALQAADRKRSTLAEALVEMGGQAAKRSNNGPVVNANTLANAQRKAIEEKKNEHRAVDQFVATVLCLIIIMGCGAALCFVPVEWHMYAVAFVCLIGAGLMVLLGRIWRVREDKQRAAVQVHIDNAKVLLRRLGGVKKD